jgi:hypothetical protein
LRDFLSGFTKKGIKVFPDCSSTLAANLADLKEKMLTLLLLADDAEEAREYRSDLESLPDFEGVKTTERMVLQPTMSRLIQLIRSSGEGPLVVPCGRPLFKGESLQKLLTDLRNPALLIR